MFMYNGHENVPNGLTANEHEKFSGIIYSNWSEKEYNELGDTFSIGLQELYRAENGEQDA